MLWASGRLVSLERNCAAGAIRIFGCRLSAALLIGGDRARLNLPDANWLDIIGQVAEYRRLFRRLHQFHLWCEGCGMVARRSDTRHRLLLTSRRPETAQASLILWSQALL